MANRRPLVEVNGRTQSLQSGDGLQIGNSNQFVIDSTGNLVKVNNVVQSWPSVQGAANTFLKNDGTGVFSWAAVTGFSVSAVLTWGNNSVSGTNVTRYLTPCFDNALAALAPIQFPAPRAGTLRNMRIHQNTPGGNGNNITYTVRVNSVTTALTVTIASTDSNASDLTHSVAVAAGDFLDIEVTKPASIGSSPLDNLLTMEFV